MLDAGFRKGFTYKSWTKKLLLVKIKVQLANCAIENQKENTKMNDTHNLNSSIVAFNKCHFKWEIQ